ncbi:hypothetical protein [Desulfoluna spongiiphila]|uniref:hypothetical protein n=1 Tax=Desulfoluna spongiiphila TaxID=419481 RepID=UPI001252A210|nr:hypothetical protein [Desulfoluna spongiiphila]VVS95578.1 hypothetical protein DBB_51550 [Desulfoluna spongiiphila]
MALTCTFTLCKTDGVTLEVKDTDGGITQTVTMDGTTITITAKGDETSTFVQIPEQISLTCKNLEVKAGSMTVETDEALTLKAGTDLKAEAGTGITTDGPTTTFKGDTLTLKGSLVKTDASQVVLS